MRLPLPDCAVKEISSLTERSYSISCLTDGGRQTHGETKAERKKKESLEGFLSSHWLFDWEVKEGSGGLFDWLTLKPRWTDLSLTLHRPEVNTGNDLLSPEQLKTKRDCGRGHLTDVSEVWLRWLLRSLVVTRGNFRWVSDCSLLDGWSSIMRRLYQGEAVLCSKANGRAWKLTSLNGTLKRPLRQSDGRSWPFLSSWVASTDCMNVTLGQNK